jgi:Flp pilus assembly pilin Flp
MISPVVQFGLDTDGENRYNRRNIDGAITLNTYGYIGLGVRRGGYVTMLVEEKSMKKLMRRFLRDEQGLELSEYAVMAALIVAALVAVIVVLRDAIGNKFSALASTIQSQTP